MYVHLSGVSEVGGVLLVVILNQAQLLLSAMPCRGSLITVNTLRPNPFEQHGAILRENSMEAPQVIPCLRYASIFIERRKEVVGGGLQIHGVAAEVRPSVPWVVVPTR